MPQAKTSISTKSCEKIELKCIPSKPASRDIRELVGILQNYEDSIRKRGISNSSDRFDMLTTAERDVVRAELVADYIRLSVGNLGNTPVYYNTALRDFCKKISEMELPSFELIGTYFAALSASDDEELLKQNPAIKKAIRKTIPDALNMCVNMIQNGNSSGNKAVKKC